MKSYSKFISESVNDNTDNQLENMPSDVLYNIANDENNSNEIVAEAILELYKRDEVELSEYHIHELLEAAGKEPSFLDKVKSTAVKAVQSGLNLGGANLKVDGKWGPKTTAAAKADLAKPLDLLRGGDKTSAKPKQMTPPKPIDTSAKSSPRPVTSNSTKPIIPKSSTGQSNVKSDASVAKSAPKTIPKVVTPVTKPVQQSPKLDQGYINDLKGSAARMKSATSDLTKSTGKTVSSLNKIAPSGRMERPISKGGMTSSQIHSNIAKLGGEPTKPVASAPKPASPPRLSSSALKKDPSSGGGKWM
jgi:hypothetical protein